MIYFISFCLALILGVVSFKRQSLTSAILTGVSPALTIIVWLSPFYFRHGDLPSKLPQHEEGEHTVTTAIIDIITGGHEGAFLLFPAVFFLARAGAWIYHLGTYQEPIAETRDLKKQRFAQEYSQDNVW